MKLRVKWRGENRELGFFFKNVARFEATLDILKTVAENEPMRFIDIKKRVGTNWILYVRQVLVPEGYLETRRRGIYYLTPKGHELILDLENKYKADKMKHLYGHVL